MSTAADLQAEVEQLRAQLQEERARSESRALLSEIEKLRNEVSAMSAGRSSCTRERATAKEIPDWTGESMQPGDAELYLNRFCRIADRSNWSDEERIDVLLTKMKGPAERFIRIKGESSFKGKTWKAVMEIFKKRFSMERDLLTDMRTLLRLKRGPGEDMRTFADRCEEAGILAFPVDELPSDAERRGAEAVMKRVVLGMFQLGTEATIRRYLKGRNVKTLEEAVELAERLATEGDVRSNSRECMVNVAGYMRDSHVEDESESPEEEMACMVQRVSSKARDKTEHLQSSSARRGPIQKIRYDSAENN